MPLSLCLCPGWFLCYLFERSFWVIHWACSSYYVCFTLNHSTLLCSLGVRRCYFPLSIFSLVLPLPFFLVNNSCTLTSSCSYLSVNKKDRNSLQVLCEVWQSRLSKANDSVFKVNINFLGLRLMALALLPRWKRHKVVIKSLSHFIINNVEVSSAYFFVSPSGHSSWLSCVVLTHAESLSQSMWEETLCKDSAGKASLDLPHTVKEFNFFTLSPLVTCNFPEQHLVIFHWNVEVWC